MMRRLVATLCMACAAFISTPARVQEVPAHADDAPGRPAGASLFASVGNGIRTADAAGGRAAHPWPEDWRLGCVNLSSTTNISRSIALERRAIGKMVAYYRSHPFNPEYRGIVIDGIFEGGPRRRRVYLFGFTDVTDVQVAYVADSRGNIVDRFVALPSFPVNTSLQVDRDCNSWE